MDAVRRLAALRALDARKERLDLTLKATRKQWADTLTEKTQTLHKLIEKPNPAKKDCANRLNEIREAFEARQEAEKQKQREVDEITSRQKKVEAAMVELIRHDPEDDQMTLDVENTEDGLGMTTDTATAVNDAIGDHVKQGGEMSPDLEDLKGQLDGMGLKAPNTLRVLDDPLYDENASE
jgi:predicted ribosome quality control (RQC) complex YloA/Tae2 family protein